MVDGEMVGYSLLLSDWPRVDWRLTGFSGRRRGACAVQSPVEQSVVSRAGLDSKKFLLENSREK